AQHATESQQVTKSQQATKGQQATVRPTHLRVPNERTIPDGPMGDAVRYGKKVFTQTQSYAAPYIGNGLNCTSCHLDAGTKAYAIPLVGLWGVFPECRARNGKVNALQDRINDCEPPRLSRRLQTLSDCLSSQASCHGRRSR